MGLFSWIADRFRRDSRPEFRGESRREWHERIIWQTETAEILSPLRKLAVTLGENPDERLATHFANVQGMNRDQRYAYVDRVFAETDAQLTQVIREDRGLPSDWDPVLDDATWHYAAGLVKSRNLAAGFPDQAASGAGESGVAADDRQATVDNSPSGRSRDDGWQSLGEEDDWQPVNVGTWRGGSVGAGEVTAPETPAQGSQQPSAGWESRHGPWQSVDGEGYDWDEDQDEGSAREQPQSGVSRASGGADRGTVERTSSVRPATQDRSAWGASATGANRDGDARQQGPQGDT
ncbi:MAG: hypothetical protein HOV68_14805 [Streptomycetaceae bacterium]|nr:hypothetical protein [Streptomycetaceae bacterium]